MVNLELEKYREDFSENEEYLKLVDISTSRKLELFNDNNLLTYHQLRKRINKSGLKFEVHHRIPRYRMKGAEKSLLNCGENLLLLTVEEHLMAHYYLVQFEVGKWKYSASMAFIQLTSLKQQDISLLNEDKLKLLVKERAAQRLNYFGSEV